MLQYLSRSQPAFQEFLQTNIPAISLTFLSSLLFTASVSLVVANSVENILQSGQSQEAHQYPEATHESIAVQEIVKAVNPRFDLLPTQLSNQLQNTCSLENCPQPLNNPDFEPVNLTKYSLPSKEKVIIVELNNAVKIYPLFMVSRHRVINDWFGSVPVAITYSPGTGTVKVYSRQLGDAATRFQYSGKDRFNNEIIFDLNSGTLWQQLTGEALTPASHVVLSSLSYTELSWESAELYYPKARVLSSGSFPEGTTEASFKSSEYLTHTDFRLPPENTVLGVVANGEAKAYDQALLTQYSVLKDVVGEHRIVISSRNGRISVTNLENGLELKPVKSSWYAWSNFYPASQLETAASE